MKEELQEKQEKQEKEVIPPGRKLQCCVVRERRVVKLVVKFSRQPTEETLDGLKPGRNPRQPAKRRRKEMFKKLMAKMQDEEGQGLVEYALIIVLVSVALVLSLQTLSTGISGAFAQIVAKL